MLLQRKSLAYIAPPGEKYLILCFSNCVNELFVIPPAKKKSFCRSADAIFGKVGRLASEEVTLQLINSNGQFRSVSFK